MYRTSPTEKQNLLWTPPLHVSSRSSTKSSHSCNSTSPVNACHHTRIVLPSRRSPIHPSSLPLKPPNIGGPAPRTAHEGPTQRPSIPHNHDDIGDNRRDPPTASDEGLSCGRRRSSSFRAFRWSRRLRRGEEILSLWPPTYQEAAIRDALSQSIKLDGGLV